MFDHLKDPFIKRMDERLIKAYPGFHYRMRKKNALRLGEQSKREFFNKHFYPQKELSKWEFFQIRSKQWLRRYNPFSLQEIKHILKPRNIIFRMKRWLSKTIEFLQVMAGAVEDVMLGTSDYSDPLDQLNRFEQMVELSRRERKLPDKCSDCGNTFKNRWRDPVQKDKHLICTILKNQ